MAICDEDVDISYDHDFDCVVFASEQRHESLPPRLPSGEIAHHRVIKANSFDWQLMNCRLAPDALNHACNGAAVSAPDRDTTNPKPGCTAWMRLYCGAHSPFQAMPLMFGFTRATHSDPLFTANKTLPFFEQDLATFLLVRGE